MHIYGKDQQAFHLRRTRAEKYFTRVNVIIGCMQLACWLASIIRIVIAAPKTMTNPMLSTSNLQLTATYKTPGCYYNVSRTHAFFNHVNFQMSAENVQYFVSRSVNNLRLLYALTGCFTVVSIVNRIFFETNTHELRYHFVIFRKDTLTTWELLLLILGIVVTLGVTRENQLLQEYVVYCGDAEARGQQYYHSLFPLVELYVSYFISLGVFVINAIIAFFNLSKENPRDRLMREDEQRLREWQEAMRKYQHPDGGVAHAVAATNHDTGGGPKLPQSPLQSQEVIYGVNAVTVGDRGPAPPAPDTASPPPALRRPQVTAPGSEAAGSNSLYANRLPGRSPQGPGSRPSSPAIVGSILNSKTGSIALPPQQQPPQQQQQQQQQPVISNMNRMSSSGNDGLYELREVYDDEDDNGVQEVPLDATNPDSVDFSVDGSPGNNGSGVEERQHTTFSTSGITHSNNMNISNVAGPRREALPPPQQGFSNPSSLATPLLATRNAAIPPPPPVGMAASNDSGQDAGGGRAGPVGAGHRPSISKMLAPPSPLNNGGDTTTDTLYM